jgi:hypothetical protein
MCKSWWGSNKPKKREFNVRKDVRRVNMIVDEFVPDNTYMGNVYFDNVSMGHVEWFGQHRNH